MKLFLPLLWMTAAAAMSLEEWSGTWIQAYSNAYVQTTSEVDWRCVTVDVALDRDEGTLLLTKHASLHGGPTNVSSYPMEMDFPVQADDVVILTPVGAQGPRLRGKSLSSRHYQIRTETPELVILTGLDDGAPAVYVWIRPGYSLGSEVLQQLEDWDYRSADKRPLSSFDISLCPPPHFDS